MYREWTRTRFRGTEFVWNCALPTLPRNKKTVAKPQNVELIGNVTVEERVRRTLELGPKFCFEPQLKAAEALAMGRAVADRVPEAEKPRCIAECAGVISAACRKSRVQVNGYAENTRYLVDYFIERKIRPLVADKEGTFALLPEDVFSEKAEQAVQKHLKPFVGKPVEVKKKLVTILQEMNLERLCAAVKKAGHNE
ncbi:hypothetical protein HPB52_009808 [Rhipicephalus sanguineus]|uniref:Uncharacterized protein n=1 Tax=Rhipicephalus sanguineus TaxID=34632 RepID=A0A9D4Q6P4_RHISA|nr:hypothetical protein HPB52_009808 [Rhipicephalus sanguineus]